MSELTDYQKILLSSSYLKENPILKNKWKIIHKILKNAPTSTRPQMPNKYLFIVLRLRMIGYTLQRTGDKIGKGRERVRQIEAKALRLLRHPIAKKELDISNYRRRT